MKILVIEDEQALLKDIEKYLEEVNLIVDTATGFRQALNKIDGADYDCVVVDINLPDGSGFDIIKHLKENKSDAGIIIVSARDSLDDRLIGLNTGSDDYLVKPFHLSELNARIHAIIRRRFLGGKDITTFREITIDHSALTVKVNSKPLHLTRKEFDMLSYFIINKNRVLSQASIIEHLWPDSIQSSDSYNFLYTHIRNLRKKLQNSGCKEYLRSIYGIGYKWEIS